MGNVWLDSDQIGTFTPQTEGTTGNILLGADDIGDFTLGQSGYVYLGSDIIGTYLASAAPPPPPPPPETLPLPDPRKQTKLFLEEYLSPSELTKDDATPVAFAVMYAYPNYPISLEFKASSNPVDLLFIIHEPESEPLLDYDQIPYAYVEHVPIEIYCIDKTGITGTKLKWKAERELRRITETFPTGSQRALERRGDNNQQLGSTILYSTRFILHYRRGAILA